MRLRKISLIPNSRRYILVMFVIAGSFIFPQASQLAYAHTFSTSESAEFLSLVDQIKAEAALATMNLQTSNNNNNNNSTILAQAHAQKASTLLLVDNNDTLGEIREVNNRIADSLEGGLKQLEGNVTALASSSSTSQGQTPSPPPQDRIQSINQTVKSLDDILAEAVSARIERTQQDNATTRAMTLAHLVNVVLSDYGNATGASFDLTDLSNMASMGGGVQMSESGSSNSNNSMAMSTTTMTINENQMQMSNNSNNTSDNNTMTMMMANNSTANSANSSSMSNTTTAATTIVDTAAYQSSQYLANNTILQLFNDKLKPLTISSNGTSVSNNNTNATTLITEQGQNNNTSLNASNNNTMSSIDKLEAGLLQLRDDINHKATPQEVMMTAHTNIHPIIMQVYGLTLEQEEGEGHTDHDES
ncbi:MAG: hypothetical protein ACJ70S_01235 [Nitrososphaera sp.]